MNRGRRTARAHLLCGAAISAVISMSGVAFAQDAEPINIPSQSLATALNSFGVQTGRAVMFKPELAAGKQSRAVDAAADPELALNELLSGTGLSWRRQGDLFMIVETAAPQSGSAAGDGADSGTVEALIVTAQKREEDIQDVPIAISAFTQEDLTRSQVAGGPDLMTQVPNMTFTKTNFSSYSIQIRGIGTQAISATTDAAVAVAFNNTPFIRNRFFEQEFYDLQRVEVLRGPQGTLYGRNATAGVVNIISAKPKFAYEAKLSGDVSNYSSTRLEGMINVPLVDDKVALRLAGAWTKREGFVDNQITGNPIDGRDLWSTRLSLRFAPTDAIDANLIWEHFKEDDDRLRSGKQLCHRDARTEIAGHPVASLNGYSALFSQGCLPTSMYSPEAFEAPNGFSLPFYHPLGQVFLPVVPGFDPYVSTTQSRDLRVIESTVDPHYTAETDLAELQVSIDLTDHLTLASETAYLVDDVFSTQDLNRFNTAPGAFRNPTPFDDFRGALETGPNGGIFCDPQIGCADRLVALDLSTAKSRHFSEELRLSSDFDGPFNFSLGANFLRYDTEDKYYVFINTLSLMAAIAPYAGTGALFGMGPMPAWEMGVSDNHECLLNGNRPPDATVFNTFVGCTYVDPNPIGSLNDQGHNYFLSRNPYKLMSYAVFGEAYYNITDTLKITAGLRWTVDKKEAPRIPSWVLGAGTVGYPVMEVIEQEWREPTGRLAIDWKPDLGFTEETLLYASYAHGYKAGGANPPPAAIVGYSDDDITDLILQDSATQPKTFDPEFVDAFEVGAKNTLLDGRLTLNADAFYYDYTGYQISQIVNRSAVNLNFDAEVWGVEIEADWRPLENLKLGFKGGYENTRVADGSRAIDLMDRTAGHVGPDGQPDWVVVKPFPTFPSNCILPLYAVTTIDGSLGVAPNVFVNGQMGPCEIAYVQHLDPVTWEPYSTTPDVPFNFPSDYPGYNPDLDVGQNHGEGFFKDLSGNELPNAPHYTATITADYTVPLPSDWLATLHTDLYYQSEAWTRIFNMEGYDKLKAYTNVNVAAIITNEDAGWKVMAYVKNVFDRDSITGAFLFSDDVGLTTNVFLTEPRLYGLRVTKEWNGGPWWTGANPNHTGPYPLTVEISGQVQRQDAPYTTMSPTFAGDFSNMLNTLDSAQNRDLDWGDGRQVKLTYRPAGSAWSLSAGIRYGRTNGGAADLHTEEYTGKVCAVSSASPYAFLCVVYADRGILKSTYNWSDVSANNREDHLVTDFAVGRDVGIGTMGLQRSSFSAGLRYAEFKSDTTAHMDGVPDYYLPEGWGFGKYQPTLDRDTWSAEAHRKFKGLGPTLSWDAAARLAGDEEMGHVDAEWSLTAGVLFGKQRTSVQGEESSFYWTGSYRDNPRLPAAPVTPTVIDIQRTTSVTVPVVDLSLGLSYEIQRIKIGAGYRWERYFDVLDAGYAEHQDADRTIDGPYFKIAVGFGG